MIVYLKRFIKYCSRILPDFAYISLKYFLRFGKFPNLKNPKTYNEKLQWLKLHDRNPEYTKMVDKYEVREYITEKIGEEYLIPLLGVWDSFDEIDFDKLPDQFVLKCTHDSGGLVICKDKSKLDIEEAKKKINKCLKTNYYWHGREWPYKNVKPRIIAEKYMVDDVMLESGLTDYKFSCFNGDVDNVMLCLDRNSGDTKYYFFDREWNLLRYNIRGKNAPEDFTLPKPSTMDKMFEIAKVLSEGFSYLRVDLYSCSDKIYFGELTFFPQSGFDANLLKETDELFGSKVRL